MVSRIVFFCFGTLGNLLPMLRVAATLSQRGHRVDFLTHDALLEKVSAAGVHAHGFPEKLNIRHSPFDGVISWSLQLSAQAGPVLLDLAKGTDLIVGDNFHPLAGLASQSLDLPFMTIGTKPFHPVMAHDPMAHRAMPVFRLSPRGRIGLVWNKMMLHLVRAVFRAAFARRYTALAARFGQPQLNYTPVIDLPGDVVPSLGLYSPLLTLPDPDGRPVVDVVGTTFDPVLPGEELDAEVTRFLESGPAPLVFSLGSNKKISVGKFHQTARRIAEALGLRAIIVRGEGHVQPTADCLVYGHVSHRLLFPHVAAIIHQGGSGTTAEAIAAGKPHLVVPFVDDQLDNAMRAHRLGTAGVIARPERFSVAAAVPVLRRLLNDPDVAARATELAGIIGKERGASVAADRIEAYLAKCAARSV